MAYTQQGFEGFFDDAKALYRKARKIQPLKVLGREVGITPGSQKLTLTDEPAAGAGMSDSTKTLLYVGGGLVLAKMLRVL